MWTPKKHPEAHHMKIQSQHWFSRPNETPDLIDHLDAGRWFRLTLALRLFAKGSNPIEHSDLGDAAIARNPMPSK